MGKSFEQFIKENKSRFPGLEKKLEREKKTREESKIQERKESLWKHGIRTHGPP
jgi:hypothetical protein